MNDITKKAYVFYLKQISLQSSSVAKQNEEIAMSDQYMCS